MIAEGLDKLVDRLRIAFVPSALMFWTILCLNMMDDRLRQLTDAESGHS